MEKKAAAHLKAGVDALAARAGKKNRIEFGEEIKVAGHRFFKGMVVEFANPAMAAYFDTAFNGTTLTTKEPNVVLGDDEIGFGDHEAPGATGRGLVDPHGVIGRGRKGIEAGTTVFEHVTGKPGASRVPLEPKDAASGVEG